jgi:hypothetical protein
MEHKKLKDDFDPDEPLDSDLCRVRALNRVIDYP